MPMFQEGKTHNNGYKMKNNLLTAENFFSVSTSGAFKAGFNIMVTGGTESEIMSCNPRQEYLSGYEEAKDMISAGKIYYTHRFKCHCGGQPDQFGGGWICLDCNTKCINRTWWNIKIQKDGNAWCCQGENFVNLQESDNYAFGDTRQEAIDNYESLMRKTAGTV